MRILPLIAALALLQGVQSYESPRRYTRGRTRGLVSYNLPKPENLTAHNSNNVFVAISHDAPVLVPSQDSHPQEPVGVKQKGPLQTNKFYANFFANKQDNATWTHPYSVWWSNDTAKQGHGLSISHTDRNDFLYGPGTPVKSFEDPQFRQSIAISASELKNDTALTTESLTGFSINVNLAPRKNAEPLLSFPLVQGMAFVTGVYKGGSVLIQSEKGFSNITRLPLNSPGIGAAVHGWHARLNDGTDWLIYMTPKHTYQKPSLKMLDKSSLTGPQNFTGYVQIAKNPLGAEGIRVFNRAAGVYPVGATISGSVSGNTGTYTLSWSKNGIKELPLLMFALPHHVKSFDQRTRAGLTDVKLASTTKGIATATFGDYFTMVESDLPTDVGLDPWSPRLGSVGSKNAPGGTVSAEAKAAIIAAAKEELSRDITELTNLTSKYFSGIAFSVYARSLYAVHNIAGDDSFTVDALQKLEKAFDRYVNNLEPNPLVYDNVWKGLVSSASYGNNDTQADFGNTYYNDHNFHYGYYVYTAAIIGHLNPSWLTKNDSINKIWVNNLIRDWANPSTEDPHFPFSRSFDWFHGHSWARGVLEAPDGKDQESSAEDAFSTYAIKVWGRTIGDADIEARGNLQLAVTARSLQSYFLMASDNDVQPPRFIGNRASGILFDRKVTHTTYFGDQISFIQGIHMLPIVPSSGYIRKPSFVREEWDQYFAGNKSGALTGGGFVGHVYVNLAIADNQGAVESYNFMKRQKVGSEFVDGLSLAWSLAYTAALGGSLNTNSTLNSTAYRFSR
ncbi:endo-beta-glucanase (glycosyl hydrolase family 81) [Colletotrichum truncatum]|uniref:Endo-beta-glucanase (Glycosyl hydrolase family 81) n=1 Tax=Colletotrichum truncatum TaxID=5467 RepID=A0ACC3Z066_COLTU|nr:endo-beta-glucanase (glycosyl hydrolase family 81) [Colletotrichum truncatum]KAF6800779.1 endo-beta-glucanase (glycosyl hydrolase family 81) [Colletotrichum truncatum]